MLKLWLSTIVFTVFICSCSAEPVPGRKSISAQNQDNYTAGDFRKVTAMTAKILERNHYSRPPAAEVFSQRIFDIFFDSLDPQHIFFTRDDVESFAAYRKSLANNLLYGEFEFAFQVYDLFRQRYAEYRQFTTGMLKKKVDFSVDETISLNMDKELRPDSRKTQMELWRKQIKNELLSFRLSERAEKENKKNLSDAPVRPGKNPAERILQRQRDVGNAIEKRERIDILGLLLDAMAKAYGAHSDYQAPKLSEDFEIHMSLSLSGIGATLTSENGYIKIVELVPGGPAELSGKLKINDRIVSVTQENGKTIDLIDMPVSQAVQYIRGEKGSKVILEVLSGTSSAPQKVEIIRDKINLTAGAAKGDVREVDGVRVGIISLPSFYMDFDAVMRGDLNARRASADVLKILDNFRKQEVQSVVIDLRGNGGGSLPDAVTLSGLFLPGGPVVQVRSKNSLSQEKDPSPALAYSGPLVILTSKMSASSAEIFTGALADAKRAVIVGDSRTFGKGTVLRVESLDRRYNNWFAGSKPFGSLTFEIAMFFRPSGSSVQQLGIVPDIQLPSLTEEMKVGEVFLDNHLPWDSIAPVEQIIWDKKLNEKIVLLKEQSAKRIANNSQYQAFIRQIKLYRDIRNRKTLSLNEEKRYAEFLREKNIAEEAEKLFADERKKDKNNGDVILNEALNIAADLSKMQ